MDRKEIAQLKGELEKQFATDRASTIKHLNDEKNFHMKQITEQSEKRIRELLSQVCFMIEFG